MGAFQNYIGATGDMLGTAYDLARRKMQNLFGSDPSQTQQPVINPSPGQRTPGQALMDVYHAAQEPASALASGPYGTLMYGARATGIPQMLGGKTAEELTYLPQGGASEAVAPTSKNFGEFMQDFHENLAKTPQEMPLLNRAEVAYQQTRTPRFTKSPETEYPELLEGGHVSGAYETAPGYKIRISQKIADPEELRKSYALGIPLDPIVPASPRERKAAASLAHEYTHARQDRNIQKRMKASRGRDVSREQASNIGMAMYRAAEGMARDKAALFGASDFLPVDELKRLTEEAYQNPSLDRTNMLLRLAKAAGYKPEEIPGIIEHFKPPEGYKKFTLEELMSLDPQSREYHANPFEMYAVKAGQTAQTGFQKFMNETFPALSGGKDFLTHLRMLDMLEPK